MAQTSVRMLGLRVLLLIALVGKSAIGVSGRFQFLGLRDYEGFNKIKQSGFEARKILNWERLVLPS